MPLDPAIRTQLLRHARTSIADYLTGRNDSAAPTPWPADLPRCGAFVTLHNHGHLRGCIGVFVTDDDLPDTIARMAVAAASDPRFRDNPLTTAELKNIHIEISLLSPLERITNPLDFDLGRHGIYIKQGSHIGCFLPEVATEADWSKETFLAECCAHKAGLGADAWNAPDTEVYRFTVAKVSE